MRAFRRLSKEASADEKFQLKCDAQSLSFYSEISVFIGEHLHEDGTFSLLDVGARTAAGTALLRAIHHPAPFARIRLEPVMALDLDVPSINFARTQYDDISFDTTDVQLYRKLIQYDIVLSSHTIEHVPDPDAFLNDLVEVAKKYVIIACPFAEENLDVGHANKINMNFFVKNRFHAIKIFRSLHWHGGAAVIALRKI